MDENTNVQAEVSQDTTPDTEENVTDTTEEAAQEDTTDGTLN